MSPVAAANWCIEPPGPSEEGGETELKGSARRPDLLSYPVAHFPVTGVRWRGRLWTGLRPVLFCFLLLSFGVYGPPSNPQATCCASGVLHSEILGPRSKVASSGQRFSWVSHPWRVDGFCGWPRFISFRQQAKNNRGMRWAGG